MMQSETPRPRQLRMRRPHLDDLPALAPPAGYGLRTFRPGDEAAWGEIMESAGGIGADWTVEKVRARMMERPQFEADGLFFASDGAAGGRLVASAAAWRVPPEERATGYVHMVCALAEHRGRGLGRLVTLAVLHYLRDHGFGDALLDTDDFRIPAVRTYLGLGFVPVYVEDPASDHVARWSSVFRQVVGRQ
jgi:mycothiol synthase